MSARINEDDRKIGQRIRAARIGAGLSQEKLGEALGLTFQQVQKYEKGDNRVSGSRLIAVARILNTTVSFLVGEENGETSERELTAMATKDGQELIGCFNRLTLADDRALLVGMARSLVRANPCL